MSGPISLNTATAKTTLPLIADGAKVKLKLQNVHWADPQEGKAYGTYRFEFRTATPVASKDGVQLNPDFPVFINIMVGDSPETPEWASPETASTRVGRILDGLLGTGDANNTKGKPQRPEFTPDLLPTIIGKTLIATAKVKPNKNNPDQEFNEFSSFVYPPEVEGA